MSERYVYVVDDDVDVLDSTRFLLEADGFAVRAFSSPREFTAAFDAAQAACLLLDLHMPEMSGLEVIQLLKKRGIATPVIVVSGRSDALLDAQLRQAGVLAILHKPADDDELLPLVRASLAAR